MSQVKAQDYILKSMLCLTDADFYRCLAGQWGDPKLIVDQYGLRKDGIPWFVKFMIVKTDANDGQSEDYLDSISFHPADSDMRLESKTVISKGWDA